MAITSILRDWADGVSIVRIVTSDTLVAVGTAGYLTAQATNIFNLNSGVFEWTASDMVLVYSTASVGGGWGFYTISSDFTSLTAFAFSTTLVGVAVVGDFANFASVGGNLEDLGFNASDPAKTKVVMAGSAVQVGYIAHFVDTSGTVDDTAGTVQNDGSIQAGKDGVAGNLISYPAGAANGRLIVSALNAGGAFDTTIRNSVMGQSSVVSIPDPGQATSKFLLTDSASTQTIATGNIAMTAGYNQLSAVNALTAHAGGGQGSATALTRQINRVTTVASAGDSVLLPAAVAGRWVSVINAAAANAMDVFPQSGEVINALAADTAISVAANKNILFFCAVAGTWNSVLTA